MLEITLTLQSCVFNGFFHVAELWVALTVNTPATFIKVTAP